jgi:FlaA1/EpsC-like NDP-sugar epimerase
LSGLIPDKDVKIEFTGLRPGEKLDEELLGAGERGVRSTRYSKIFVVEALRRDGTLLESGIKALEAAARAGEAAAIRRALQSLNIGYQSNSSSERPEEPVDAEINRTGAIAAGARALRKATS